MKIINLTPHPITITVNNKTVKYPAEQPLRLKEETKLIDYIEEEIISLGVYDDPYESPSIVKIPLYKKRFIVENLPPRQSNTLYIVSSIVAQLCPDRDDFIVPNDLIRDEQGRVVGARSFANLQYWR